MQETLSLQGIEGVISAYRIPEEWAQDKAQFEYWWLPKTQLGEDGLYHIIQEARVSDESKAQRLVKEPVHNLIVNAGIALFLTNISVQTQGAMYPITQILSAGNGTCTGVLRSDTSVPGDGFISGARKAPTSYTKVGFLTNVYTTYASGDGVGTWTSVGWYGRDTVGNHDATTTTGSGALMTHALFPYVKGSTAIVVNYSFLLSN